MNIHSPKFRSKVIRVLFLVTGWVLANIYVSVIHMAGMMVILDSLTENDLLKGIPVEYDFTGTVIRSSIQVFIAGIFLASVEVFYFTDRFRKRSFTYAVLMKTIFYATGLLLFTLFFSYADAGFKMEKIFPDQYGIFFVWGPIFLISSILLQVSDKYGQGVLLNFIMGKYHTLKNETRIFMFLDLKSSTTIAEALGNKKYFELLKDFFFDVTDAIIENKGEIYQYVGDEIVISWKLNNGAENSNCLKCFFDIQSAITVQSEKYVEKYDLVPSFKAAVHYGEVTVGEVGVLKRDITFSGDVLNTTARIQELCNKYNEKLIASKNILDVLNNGNDFTFSELGKMNLRGRSEPVVLYSVRIER